MRCRFQFADRFKASEKVRVLHDDTTSLVATFLAHKINIGDASIGQIRCFNELQFHPCGVSFHNLRPMGVQGFGQDNFSPPVDAVRH